MPLRRTILYLSRHEALRDWVQTSPAARKLSSRFVAGSRLADALDVCRKMRVDGITATLDYLGENVKSLDEANALASVKVAMLTPLNALPSVGVIVVPVPAKAALSTVAVVVPLVVPLARPAMFTVMVSLPASE